jgi:protein-disulfide isomerase
MAAFPNDVRLVIRYTPLHKGSDEAVRILEAARLQNRFEPVIETLLAMQPNWAAHSAPNLEKAWQAAAIAGLDLERARADATRPEIAEVLRQDTVDFKTVNGRGTPTFFVNEKPLPSFGAQQLYDLVRDEVARVSGTK